MSIVPGGLGAAHVCLEATGSHHEAVVCCLHDRDVLVAVVNPLLVKRFAETKVLRNKTDGDDAKCLAMFGRAHQPARWEAPTPGVRALQALMARLDALRAMRQAECNRLALAHPSVAPSVQSMIAELDRAIALANAQIKRTITDDTDLKQRARLLQSSPAWARRRSRNAWPAPAGRSASSRSKR